VKRAEKAAKIGQILDELYPQPPIPLGHSDPFTLLVAVALSAQTTDARVNLVTPALFARAATPEAMARMPESEILSLIRTCGLAPTKAKNLKRLAQTLVDEYGGQVPRDMAELEKLPGVGHKTASVVMTQAFGRPAFPVDTHIHRLAQRWGLSNGKSVEQTERDLKKLFPPEDWGKRHLQIIYFGREYCPARGHDQTACPICSWASPKRANRR
jgi:endonuclease-3